MIRLASSLLLIGTALTFAACNGPKAISKRAGELHSAGFNPQAADLYYLALRKRPGYVDAMTGLQMTGQGVIDSEVGEFQRAAMSGERAEAIAIYDRMTAFKNKIAGVGITLLIPSAVEQDHDDLMDDHLIELSEQGQSELEAEDFAAAEKTYREILRLDPEYGDAASLLVVARAEPPYREGSDALDMGQFREAHRLLSTVTSIDGEYKDAAQLRDDALDLGRFNVAITEFEARNRDRDVALELRSGLQQGLFQSSDPFIGVVDRTLREDILAEQELSLSGISDESVEVGGIAGARAMLTGSILSYSSETSTPQSTPRKGFRKYFKEVMTEEGNTKKVAAFSPAGYVMHTQRRSVLLKYEIKLVSTETGEILMSEVEQVHAQDAVEYAVSQVNAGSLYPARANGEVDRSGKRRMNALLSARRELTPASALRAQIIREATARGLRDVEQFLANHIE